jgi:hypothetical protein
MPMNRSNEFGGYFITTSWFSSRMMKHHAYITFDSTRA